MPGLAVTVRVLVIPDAPTGITMPGLLTVIVVGFVTPPVSRGVAVRVALALGLCTVSPCAVCMLGPE